MKPKAFFLHGRGYWLDPLIMDILNYCYSYSVSIKIASAALGINLESLDMQVPEVELYLESLKWMDSVKESAAERKYVRSKLYNVMDNADRAADIIKAIETIVAMTLTEADIKPDMLKGLTYEQLIELLDKTR